MRTGVVGVVPVVFVAERPRLRVREGLVEDFFEFDHFGSLMKKNWRVLRQEEKWMMVRAGNRGI